MSLILGIILIVAGAILRHFIHEGIVRTLGYIMIVVGVIIVVIVLILILAGIIDSAFLTLAASLPVLSYTQ